MAVPRKRPASLGSPPNSPSAEKEGRRDAACHDRDRHEADAERRAEAEADSEQGDADVEESLQCELDTLLIDGGQPHEVAHEQTGEDGGQDGADGDSSRWSA